MWIAYIAPPQSIIADHRERRQTTTNFRRDLVFRNR